MADSTRTRNRSGKKERRQRHERELAMKVGRYLLGRDTEPQRIQKFLRTELARCLEVDERTLRDWKRMVRTEKAPSPCGRPPHGPAEHSQALWSVGREWRRQKRPGWRPVAHALAGKVPTRLVQEYVELFKARRRKRHRARIERHRVRTQVLARNAIWTQDGTLLGRIGRRPVDGQIVKDRGPLKTIGAFVDDRSATGASVIKNLTRSSRSGASPSSTRLDNGSPYCNEQVAAYLAASRSIHLRSLPRTPQHNGAAEIGIQGMKQAAALGCGVEIRSVDRSRS